MPTNLYPTQITLFCNRPPRNAVVDYIDKSLIVYPAYASGEKSYQLKTPSLHLDNFRLEISDADSYAANGAFSGTSRNSSYMKVTTRTSEGENVYYYFIDTFERVSNTVARINATLDVLNTYFQPKDVYGKAPDIWKGISGKSRINRLIVDRLKDVGQDNPRNLIDEQPENINPAQFMKGEPAEYKGLDISDSYIRGRAPDGWVLLIATINDTDRLPTALLLPRWNSVTINPASWEQSPALVVPSVETDSGISQTGTIRLLSYNDIDLTAESIIAVYSLPCFPGAFSTATNDLADFKDYHTFKAVAVSGGETGLTFPLKVSEEGTGLYGITFAIAIQNGLSSYALPSGEGNAFLALKHNEQLKSYPVNFVPKDTLTENLGDVFVPAIKGTPNESDKRYLIDPKIFNSEFTKWKFIYDNSALEFRFEEYEAESGVPTFSRQLNFSLGFSGQYYFKIDINGTTRKYRTSPYDDILQLSRSNKEPFYTSEYWNYMRNGYNYDVKGKNLADASSWIGVATGLLSTVGSSAVAMATGNIFAGAQAVGSVGSTLNSLSGAILGSIQRQNSIDKKIATAQASGVQVKDLTANDLFRTYNGSEFPILCKFEPRDEIKTLLDDLFYYYGYARSETMSKESDSFEDFRETKLASRHWFNYVEMAIEWKADYYYLDDNIMNEIANKFAEGVTVFHIGNDGTYDFEQTKENWEVWAL